MRVLMLKQKMMVAVVLSLTAGCAVQPASGQDLSTARFMLEDGCYWYEHSGPVETTLLPLRTANGNPICVAREV